MSNDKKSKEKGSKLLGFHHKGLYSIVKVNNNGTDQIKCGNFKKQLKSSNYHCILNTIEAIRLDNSK